MNKLALWYVLLVSMVVSPQAAVGAPLIPIEMKASIDGGDVRRMQPLFWTLQFLVSHSVSEWVYVCVFSYVHIVCVCMYVYMHIVCLCVCVCVVE